MLESTEDLLGAKSWAESALGSRNAAKYFMGKANFVIAYRDLSSFSFVIARESMYGQLYGTTAHFDERCQSVALADSTSDSFHDLKRGGSSQFWEAVTLDNGSKIELLQDAAEINQVIDVHAPDSSVRPGDPEEVFWGGIRDQVGELVACAVVVRWQSGFHVLSSVVTRTPDRGKGYGTALSRGIISHAYSLGIEEIGLGVRTANIAAQRAYQRAGFKMIGAFTNYSRA